MANRPGEAVKPGSRNLIKKHFTFRMADAVISI